MGCGSVADYGHLPAILNIPELELVALFDPVPDRAATFASRFGNPSAHESLQSFFETPMDAVAITSPAPTHRDNVLACALHGLDVLCEKPIAMDDNEAEEMIAAMEKADKLFAIGFCYRFSPVALQIHRWIREGVIGQVRSLRLLYVWNLHGRYVKLANGTWEESPVWRGRMVEGGPMVDCGVHQIDLARWWLGSEVATHHGFGAWVADYEAPDHQYLHLTHENGIHTR
jgi:predicted dehydrogenase